MAAGTAESRGNFTGKKKKTEAGTNDCSQAMLLKEKGRCFLTAEEEAVDQFSNIQGRREIRRSKKKTM